MGNAGNRFGTLLSFSRPTATNELPSRTKRPQRRSLHVSAPKHLSANAHNVACLAATSLSRRTRLQKRLSQHTAAHSVRPNWMAARVWCVRVCARALPICSFIPRPTKPRSGAWRSQVAKSRQTEGCLGSFSPREASATKTSTGIPCKEQIMGVLTRVRVLE